MFRSPGPSLLTVVAAPLGWTQNLLGGAELRSATVVVRGHTVLCPVPILSRSKSCVFKQHKIDSSWKVTFLGKDLEIKQKSI
jgi:hypothetical protein